MNVIRLSEDEMYSLVNPPDSCRVPETEPGLSYFQAEVKELYQELLLRLSPLSAIVFCDNENEYSKVEERLSQL